MSVARRRLRSSRHAAGPLEARDVEEEIA